MRAREGEKKTHRLREERETGRHRERQRKIHREAETEIRRERSQLKGVI